MTVLFARSQRTLHADQIQEAIREGAIGFLKGVGKRSVEVMRGRSLMLLRIQEAIGEGAIGFLKGFGKRSVEVMMVRSLMLLRIQEAIAKLLVSYEHKLLG